MHQNPQYMHVGLSMCAHTHTYTHPHTHTCSAFWYLPHRQHNQSGSNVGRDRLTFTATGLLGHSGREGGREKKGREKIVWMPDVKGCKDVRC